MPSDPPSDRPVDADNVATKSFNTAFRGFDQAEVREYLTAISSALRDLKTEQDALLLRLSVAEQRAVPTAELDPTQLTQMLGEETARVLETALTSAEQIRSKADAHATSALAEANQEAADTRVAADEYASTTRDQADQAAQTQRDDADTYASELRAQADTEAEATRTAADEYAAEVRQRADQEAEATRTSADAYALETREQADVDRDHRRSEADAYAAEVRERVDAESSATRSEADTYATGVRQKADAEVRQLRDEAAADAERMRGEAAEVLGERTTDAEEAAAAIRDDAEAIRAKATEDANAEVERGRARGDALLAEARAQRDEVNKEIARRRRASARARAGQRRPRRLLEAYSTVRQLADDATVELDRALPEARAAAEAVARQAATAEDEIRTRDEAGVPPGPSVAESDGEEPDGPAPIETAEPVAPVVDQTQDDQPGAATVAAPGAAVAEAEVVDEASGAADARADDAPAPAPAPPVAGGAPATDEAKPARKGRRFGRHKHSQPEAPAVAPGEPATADQPVDESEPADVDALVREGSELGREPEAGVVADEGSTTTSRSEDEASEVAPAPAGEGLAPVDGKAVSAAEDDDDRVRGPFGLRSSGAGSAGTGAGGDGGAEQVAGAGAPGVVATADEARSVTLFEQRDRLTDDLERKLGRKLKRSLSDEQNSVLDSARRTRDAVFADVVPELGPHRGQYAEPAAADLAAAMRSGWDFYTELAAESGGPPPDAGAPRPDVSELADALAAELVGPLRERIERCFVEAEGDEFELSDRIRACYREWKAQRLSDAARNYVLSAFSRGVYAAAPAGASLAWLAEVGDPAACPDCEDNSLAGPQPKGEAFPTGHLQPPAHPGCRCLLVPA